MRKPWVYRRKNIKGWWAGWYEGRKRKSKALPSKKLAEHFCHIKYAQLTNDIYTNVDPALRKAMNVCLWRSGCKDHLTALRHDLHHSR